MKGKQRPTPKAPKATEARPEGLIHGYCKCPECRATVDFSAFREQARNNMKLLKRLLK